MTSNDLSEMEKMIINEVRESLEGSIKGVAFRHIKYLSDLVVRELNCDCERISEYLCIYSTLSTASGKAE